MRKIYTLIFIIISIFCSGQLSASHMLGSELSMQNIGGDTFRVVATYYRNCNGTTFNDTVHVKIRGLNSSYTGILKLAHVSSEDITHLCPSAQSRCQNSSSSFPYGIQKHQFADTVYLGNKGACDFYLSITETARNVDPWTTTNFYNYLKINICQSAPNSSPVLQEDPLFLLCAEKCTQHFFGGYDADGDSLVYSLAPALSDSATSIPYSSPYSYDKPLYFTGFPNASLPFNPPLCRGFHLDPVLGMLQFKPAQAQITWMDVKVEEYRSGVKIGEIQRDWQVIIMNCNASSDTIAISSGAQTSHYTTCPGDTFRLGYTISGFNGADSNAVTWDHGIPGAIVNITGDTSTKYLEFIWAPDSADAAQGNFSFAINIKGKNCPLPDELVKNVKIIVEPSPSATYSATATGCGDLEIHGNNARLLYEWDFGGNNQVTTHHSTLHFNSGGDKPFTVRAFKDQCSQTFKDTATIPSYVNLEVSAGPDKSFCEGDSFSVKATVLSGNGGYHYLWLPSQFTGQIYKGISSQSQQFIVQVTDTQGCKAQDTIYATVRKLPKITLTPLPAVCADRDTLDLSPYASGTGIWSGPGVTGNKLAIAKAKNGDYFKLSYTDTAGCTNTDSVHITINPLSTVLAGPDSLLCIKNPAFSLIANPPGGVWTGTGVIQQGFNFKFDPQAAGVGQHELIYNFTDINNCKSSDTAIMTVDVLTPVDAGSDTSVCRNSTPFALRGHPAGGSWAGAGISGSTFNPSAAGVGIHYLVYDYSGIQDCANKDSIKVIVRSLPTLILPIDTSLCVDQPPLPLYANPPGGIWSGTGVQGNYFTPSAAGIGTHHVIYKYSDLNQCTNQDTINLTVRSVPQIQAVYQPLSTEFQVQFNLNTSDSLVQVEWDFGDGTFGTQKNPVHTYPPVTDSYTVIVSAMGMEGCFATDTVKVAITITGIEDSPWLRQVKVYPNPATSRLNIHAEGIELEQLRLHNALGQQLYSTSNPGNMHSIDLKNYPPGIYFFGLTNNDQETAWLKVVTQER